MFLKRYGLFCTVVFLFITLALHGAKPEKFYFSIYSMENTTDLAKLKRDGFTAIGPYYGDPFVTGERVLKHAKLTGLDYICSIGIYGRKKYKALSLEELKKIVSAQIIKLRGHKEITAWSVMPDELRWWIPKELKYLKMVKSLVNKLDPLKRPVWMYEPNNRNIKGLSTTIVYQDALIKSVYPDFEMPANVEQERVWCNWPMEQAREALKKTGQKIPIYAVLGMAKNTKHPELLREYARHDAYSVILNGAKGILIWSGFRRPKFTRFNDYYAGYASVARDLNGKLELGKVFLNGIRSDKIKLKVVAGPKTETVNWKRSQKQVKNTYPSVNMAMFKLDSDYYIFAVNSSMKEVTVEISKILPASSEWNELFKAGKQKASNGLLRLKLAPLEVCGLKLSK